MIVAIDVDDVCAKLSEVWLGRYNKDYDDSLKDEDLKEWSIDKFVKPECGKKIYNYLDDPSLYDDVVPREDALYGVKTIRKMGHRVIFVTATPMKSAGRKFTWLADHKFKPELRDYVEANDKSLIFADMLFDDSYNNAMKFRGIGVLLTRPWNIDLPYAYRVPDWENFLKIVKVRGQYE